MVVSTIVLLLIIFSVAPAIVFSVPAVQRRVVNRVAQVASEYIGARVEVGKITFRFFNSVTVRDFYVEDWDGDTLLYVNRADATIGPISSLREKNLVLKTGKVTGGKFILRETERGTYNVKEITDLLVRRDRKSDFRLDIPDLAGSGIEFRLHRRTGSRDEGVDFANMQLLDIDVQMKNFMVLGGVVEGDVESLAFTERTGFKLDDLTGHFNVDFGKIRVSNAKITTAKSEVNLDYLLLDGEDWLEYKDFIDKVPIICHVSDCTLSSDDVGYFAPEIWRWETTLYNITASMTGPVSDFKGRLDHAGLEHGGELSGSVHIKGLIDVENTHFDVKVDRVNAPIGEVKELLGKIARISIKDGRASEILSRVERVDAEGEFNGTIHNFEAKARNRMMNGGWVSVDCGMKSMAHDKKDLQVRALNAENLDLGYILSQKLLGETSFTSDGTFTIDKSTSLGITGVLHNLKISNFGFKGYVYKNILLSTVRLEDSRVDGTIKIDDRALSLASQGALSVDWSDRTAPCYRGTLRIDNINLARMNIDNSHKISVITGTGITKPMTVDLNVRGRTFDDMNGSLKVRNLKYGTMAANCTVESMVVDISRRGEMRKLNLTSDIATAKFESTVSYKDIVSDLRDVLMPYAPNLYNEKQEQIAKASEVSSRNSSMVLKFKILQDDSSSEGATKTKVNRLLACLTNGLQIADNSTLTMKMAKSAKGNTVEMNVQSDYLLYNKNFFGNINGEIVKEGDALRLGLSAEDPVFAMMQFSVLNIEGGLRDNKLRLDVNLIDSERDVRAVLNTDTYISRKNNHCSFLVNINESSLSKEKKSWDITTDGIEIDSARVDIRRFTMRNKEQELFVNGIASRNDRDSLYFTMRNFSLNPLSQITNRIGYVVNARTNGYATIHSALKDMRINARIEVDSLNVSGLNAPDMLLTSKWDFGANKAKLEVSDLEDGTRYVDGYFWPSKMSYYARLKADNINMAVLDPPLGGVITDTKGKACYVDVKIEGVRRDATLSGSLMVDSLSTTIAYTNCRYNAPRALVQIENNTLSTSVPVPIYDAVGNKGEMSLSVSLQHLRNIDYKIDIMADNMKVLNTTEQDNPIFYGSIFASGKGTVSGNKTGVEMSFDAKSGDNSKFFMPLTGSSDVSSTDFINFVSQRVKRETSESERKRDELLQSLNLNSASGGKMDVKLNLDVRSNTEMQLVIDQTVGDIIKARGNGKLNIDIVSVPDAPLDLKMYGTYAIEKGSYLFTLQNVINKWFDIEPGSTIMWNGDPMDALLDIEAKYGVKASLQPLLAGSLANNRQSSRAVPVECIINITDNMMHPNVDFDIKVPNVDLEIQNIISSVLSTPESKAQQFLYLIVANSFISEATNSMSSSIGASVAAATGFELLSNQFSNWLSGSNAKVVLRYRPRTEQMSDEVDFGFSKSLVDDRLLIEVEGNYIVDKAQVVNANSNFTGEAYLTWLIDSEGALRLRGFTHTIDRFDENQGLQETGVGIYYKEDFENAEHLRQRLKARFKRNKKDKNAKTKSKKERNNKNKADSTAVAEPKAEKIEIEIEQQTK